MYASQIAPASAVDGERLFQLAQDVIEVASFYAIGCVARIAVHRITTPQHGLTRGANGLDQSGQALGDGRMAKPMNQREPSRLVVLMKTVKQVAHHGPRHGRTHL